jgi:PST family polysaccharide transporter
MWRELVRFGRSILASEIFREGGRITVVAVVGRTLTPAGLGQFNFGARFANQLNGLIVSSSAFALFPVLSRISGDEARMRTAFLRALRILVLVAAPASFFFLAFGRPLVTLLLGPRWGGAGAVLTGMSAIVLAGALISVCGETFKARGTPGLSLRAQIVLSTLTVLGVLVTYPHGLLAVGIGISFAWTVTGLYSIWLVRRSLGIPLRVLARQVGLPLTAAVTIALLFLLLDRHVVDAGARGAARGIPLLVGEALLAAAAYACVVFVASRRQFDDLVDAVRLARRGSGLDPK